MIDEDIGVFSSMIGKKPRQYRLALQRSRWGSCSYRHHLSFNKALIFTPRDTIRYVVAHEMSHMQHFDHSSRFWHLVETLLPNYQPNRVWLNHHGQDVLALAHQWHRLFEKD